MTIAVNVFTAYLEVQVRFGKGNLNKTLLYLCLWHII